MYEYVWRDFSYKRSKSCFLGPEWPGVLDSLSSPCLLVSSRSLVTLRSPEESWIKESFGSSHLVNQLVLDLGKVPDHWNCYWLDAQNLQQVYSTGWLFQWPSGGWCDWPWCGLSTLNFFPLIYIWLCIWWCKKGTGSLITNGTSIPACSSPTTALDFGLYAASGHQTVASNKTRARGSLVILQGLSVMCR